MGKWFGRQSRKQGRSVAAACLRNANDEQGVAANRLLLYKTIAQ